MASIANNLLTPTNLLLEAKINDQIINLVGLLQESNNKSIMICTPGPKSIGKTYFNNKIKELIGLRVTILSVDDFFKDKKFNPKMLYKAYQQCQLNSLEKLLEKDNQIVLIDNPSFEMWQMKVFAEISKACNADFMR